MIDIIYDVLTTIIVFCIGLLLCVYLSQYFTLSKSRGLVLYLYHSTFSIVFAVFILHYGGDAIVYYKHSFLLDAAHPQTGRFLGKGSVLNFLAPFTQLFSIPFVAACLIFQIFGTIGLYALDSSLKSVAQGSSRSVTFLASAIMFLPSMNFWSSGVGKDSISFMAVCLLIWGFLNPRRRFWIIGFAFFAMFAVRAHMAAVILIAISLTFIFEKSVALYIRFSIISVLSLASLKFIPFAANYAGIRQGLSPEVILNYIEKRQRVNQNGGSSLDIASMSYPEQLITYLLRPWPWEAHNLSAFAASLDNLILLMLFSWGLIASFKKSTKHAVVSYNKYFMVSYVILSWSMLAMTTPNLGIAVRQKWMFVPVMIFLVFTVIASSRQKNVPVSLMTQDKTKTDTTS